MTKKNTAAEVTARLKERYPDAICSLEYTDPLQLLIATRLSAQCTDARVNMVTPALFERFPNAEAFAAAEPDEVGEYIRTCGLFRTKARDIVMMCRDILARFEGKVPDTLEDLITLPGVGRKTANLIMGDVYGKTQDQLSFEPEVIEKQKALIDMIHEMGGKVLMSTHLSRFFEEDELMEYAHAQRARGADLVKIVTKADTPEQEAANLMITYRLKRELDCPFLFLSGGTYTRLIRQIGPALGCCMYLCVQRYHPVTAKAQPRLRSVKAIRDNMLL